MNDEFSSGSAGHAFFTAAARDQRRALFMSTAAFTACFAVWTVFSIIGLRIKQELGLNEFEFGLLIGTPILTGSLSRILLGVWTDQYGGRLVLPLVMLFSAASTLLLAHAGSYEAMLAAALGVGLAGGSFAVGVAYVSKWYPQEKQGTALGIFGVGNIGAAITNFVAPFVLVSYGWIAVAQIWAGVLAAIAVLFWLTAKEEPALAARKARGLKPPSMLEALEPLRKLQVWRFSLYYFFVFGGFVALTLWLPRYLVGVYELDVKTAGILTTFFSLPAAVFRAYGGRLADRYGARRIMYWTFGAAILVTFMLSYPKTDYVIHGIRGPIAFSTSVGLIPFIILTAVLSFFMSLGSAAVYKHIPAYYPRHVGTVGGLVGMMGGIGGFVLPIAFGVMLDLTGIWTSCFALLFGLVSVAMIWMHVAIRQMEREAGLARIPALPQLPEFAGVPIPAEPALRPSALIEDWRPEDTAFWTAKGRRIAQRNLWISIPCLMLAFAVWTVWSVVVAKLPAIGFRYTTDQLFWLAALPGLSGATLRIFYSFIVPIFGGRLWTTLSTASLLIPAFGIGYAVQNPDTPYLLFLVLALLCGLGGGNFASSMANISFFFPKAQKGTALALNAGLGNLGVSIMQLAVPLVMTAGVFGALGGPGQTISDGTTLWLQNAGFIWVPFVIVCTVAAWFGMNDIAAAKASLSDQLVIFQRRHNWVMCWLYTGTFGSFIGYSASFPLLAETVFPQVDALKYAFIGPLLGALSRVAAGWIADRYGGARVTLWTFLLMMAGVAGVLYFLDIRDQPGAFWGFFAMFLVLFVATGVGNASIFQMIPVVMQIEMPRLMLGAPEADRTRQAERESAAIIGFTSAIAAYGAFFIPKAYGSSIAMTGAPTAALWTFMIYYASCTLVTWYVYARRGGLLHDAERGGRGGGTTAAAAATAER